MTRKNMIQRGLCVLLILIMCMGMAGCEDKEPKQKEVVVHDPANADYSIVKVGKQLYLKFDVAPTEASSSDTKLSFATLTELRDAVLNGAFSKEQKQMIKSFHKDEQGRIPICDFINIQPKELPQGFQITMVGWYGNCCYLDIQSANRKTKGAFVLRDEATYQREFERNYTEYHDRENVTISKTETEGQKKVTYYSTSRAEFKTIQYALNSGGKQCYILREYILPSESSVLQPSETIPYAIVLFCVEDGQYYTVSLLELTEDPTDEWLLKFGLEKYTEK